MVLALDAAGAEHARRLGLIAEGIWTDDAAELACYAARRGILRGVRGEVFGPLEALLEARS